MNMNTIMKHRPKVTGLGRKLAYALLALACLAIGLLGIILPVIPGLVFLLFAGLAAARLSHRVDNWLRKLPAAGSYLDQTSGFFRLGWLDKARYCFWVTLQLSVDSLRVTWHVLRKLGRGLFSRQQGFQ